MNVRTTFAVLGAAIPWVAGAALAAQPAGSLEKRFRRLDRNGDGAITPQELPNRRWFERVDANGDGAVTRDEAAAIARMRRAGVRRNRAAEFDGVCHRDIRYAGDAETGSPLQCLDVYTSEKAKAAPVMVYVHGGGWKRGDKRAVGRKAAFFVDSGFVFVSVNYRLLPEGRHPNNVDDLAAALGWVHDHVARYGGDPGAIFLMGHSAGCHLVSLVATDHRRLAKHGKSPAILRGVVANDTQTYDLPALIERAAGTALYRDVFGTDPETQRDASPLHHVARGKHVPPFLILYSAGIAPGRENPGWRAQAEAFAAALRDAGVHAEVVDASDRTHAEINQRLGDLEDDVTGRVMSFINAIRNGRASATPCRPSPS